MMEGEIQNTLLDNSLDFYMVYFLESLILRYNITSIDIATGYWDILVTSTLYKVLCIFLEIKDAKFCILISEDLCLFLLLAISPDLKHS